MNEDVKDTFIKRSKIISEIRKFLVRRDLWKFEHRCLYQMQAVQQQDHLRYISGTGWDVKLRISLELYLKRLIVGGMERVYEIGRVFRNEGTDTRHNPEFTLMELYQAFTDYYGMMDLTENMFRHLAEVVCGTTLIPYAEAMIDLGKPFEELRWLTRLKYAGIDFNEIKTTEEAKALAKETYRV